MMIEPAHPSDLPTIRELLRACNLPDQDLTSGLLAGFLVARAQSGGIQGVVGIQKAGRSGLLRSLAVAPEARGRGLGGALVRQGEALAARRGLKTLYLLTTSADSFFSALGYAVFPRGSVPKAVAATSEFKTICPQSAICMLKELDYTAGG